MTSKRAKRRRQDRLEHDNLKTVNSTDAKKVIKRQVRPARAQLAKQAQEAKDIAATIAPWLGEAAWKRGQPETDDFRYTDTRYIIRVPPNEGVATARVCPELRHALEDALAWIDKSNTEMDSWHCKNQAHHDFCTSHVIMGPIPEAQFFYNIYGWSMYLVQPENRYRCTQLEREVKRLHDSFRSLAKRLSRASVSDPVTEMHPPRYERLRPGVLERVFREDVDTQIEAGHSLRWPLKKGSVGLRKVQDWNDATASVLAHGLSDETVQRFKIQTNESRICNIPQIDRVALSSAYLELGLIYLEEVRERMSDYSEAAGQRPQVSITISGGTFHGSQIAAHITNIESTISSVAQQGDRDVAQALAEITEVVLAQEGLDKGQRQDLLDSVEYLAEAANTPPEKRKSGVIKSTLRTLEELGNAINPWVSTVDKFLS